MLYYSNVGSRRIEAGWHLGQKEMGLSGRHGDEYKFDKHKSVQLVLL